MENLASIVNTYRLFGLNKEPVKSCVKAHAMLVDNWADYWKSNERKFCDFCKCWIADNKPSIQFHENGKRHKANVAKRITEISKKSAKDEKAKQKFDMELRKMEDAAMKAYLKDCSQMGDMSSQGQALEPDQNSESYGFQTVDEAGDKVIYTPKVDPMLKGLPEDFHEDDDYKNRKNLYKGKGQVGGQFSGSSKPNEATIVVKENSLWCEAVSDEGHTYYWNVKTGDSVWEPPKEGYMKIAEYNKINEQAKKQQEEVLKKESQNLIQNADEIVAKYRREGLKKYRSRIADATDKDANNTGENDNIKRDPEILATEAQPYGQWQSIVKVEEKLPDLQLPKCDYYYAPPPIVPEHTLPVKEFKEKTVKLDTEVTANEVGVFKKRKIAFKMNARKRLDDD